MAASETTPMDWQLNRSLSECTSHLCMNEHMSDVTIVLTSGDPPRRVPAHRFVLAIRSPVFEAMFYGSLKSVEKEVTLSGVPVDGFITFLRYLYTDVAEIGSDIAVECLQVGHMYRVPDFVAECETILMRSIDAANVCCLIETGIIFNLEMLKTQCMEYIKINTLSVITSKSFLSLSREVLKMIVGESGLQAPELEIYKGVSKWADSACERGRVKKKNNKRVCVPITHANKRQFLGDVFFDLRLGHIPVSDFASVVANDNLLSENEMLMVFRYHHDSSVSKLDFVENAKRAGTVVCSVPMQMSQSRRLSPTQFIKKSIKCNRGINCVGISITDQSGSFHQKSGYSHILCVMLVEKYSPKPTQSTKNYAHSAMYRLERDTSAVGSTSHFDILFDQAFFLKPDKTYILCIFIACFPTSSLTNLDLRSLKFFGGKRYTRHHYQDDNPFNQYVTLQSLLSIE